MVIDWTDFEARQQREKERNYHRRVFRVAYNRFQELKYHCLRAQDLARWEISGGRMQLLMVADWLADFHLAGREILSGREERLFSMYYMMVLSINSTMRALDLHSRDSFWAISKMVEEKVGAELLRRGLWPLRTRWGAGYFD